MTLEEGLTLHYILVKQSYSQDIQNIDIFKIFLRQL